MVDSSDEAFVRKFPGAGQPGSCLAVFPADCVRIIGGNDVEEGAALAMGVDDDREGAHGSDDLPVKGGSDGLVLVMAEPGGFATEAAQEEGVDAGVGFGRIDEGAEVAGDGGESPDGAFGVGAAVLGESGPGKADCDVEGGEDGGDDGCVVVDGIPDAGQGFEAAAKGCLSGVQVHEEVPDGAVNGKLVVYRGVVEFVVHDFDIVRGEFPVEIQCVVGECVCSPVMDGGMLVDGDWYAVGFFAPQCAQESFSSGHVILLRRGCPRMVIVRWPDCAVHSPGQAPGILILVLSLAPVLCRRTLRAAAFSPQPAARLFRPLPPGQGAAIMAAGGSPMTTVLSLGGSIVAPDSPDAPFLAAFVAFVNRYLHEDESRRLILVVGGGGPARSWQKAYREALTAPQTAAPLSSDAQDWIGIAATRLNAQLVAGVLGAWCLDPVVTDPTAPFTFTGRVLVAAGWKPGFSTDFDAVVLAERFGARSVLNLSNIAKVYTADPRTDPSATPIDQIDWASFRAIVGDEWSPGKNVPFDPVATRKAAELGLLVICAAGKDLANLEAILSGKPFTGTSIGPD